MNNKDFISYFGIEMHIEVLAKNKAFSSTAINYNYKPNKGINEYDIGLPGAKPVVNREFVKKSIIASSFFNMEITKQLDFDRKHYFYTDLPKGYQITQHTNPLGKNGYILLSDKTKILVKRLHLEEDTAKQIHKGGKTLINYNRAGNPLIEIVADHSNVNSLEHVREYIESVKNNLTFLGITNGKMEEGSIRIDANISVKDIKNNVLSPKIEIKNINSINNLIYSLSIESKELQESLLNKKEIKQVTKRFDDKSKVNVLMREKEDKEDYRYIAETNILPIKITKDFIDQSLESKKLSYNDIKDFLLKKENKVSQSNMDVLLIDNNLSNFVYKNIESFSNKESIINFISNIIFSYLKKGEITTDDFNINKEEILKFLLLLDKDKITNSNAKSNIKSICSGNIKTKAVLDSLKDDSIDIKDIKDILNSIVLENKETILKEYDTRPERIEKMIMGQVMKKTKGKANPKESMALAKEILANFK